MSTSIAIPELNHERGFLPLQDPLKRLPGPLTHGKNWHSVCRSYLHRIESAPRSRIFLASQSNRSMTLANASEPCSFKLSGTRLRLGWASARNDLAGRACGTLAPGCREPGPASRAQLQQLCASQLFSFRSLPRNRMRQPGSDPEFSRRYRRGVVHPDPR